MEKLNYRHELKFICSDQRLFLLENKIRHICVSDSHACSGGTYVVRSLYFDTYDNKCLLEGMAGTDNRRKYRVRIYNRDNETIKLECKHSFRGMKAKETCLISREQCECLINDVPVGEMESSQELLRRFMWEKSTKLLKPKVIVEYTRAPYVYTLGNVRVTFDRDICSSADVSRFLEKDIQRRGILQEGKQLLEVKYDEAIPSIVLELLTADQQLSRISFSKYVLCRQYGMNWDN